MKSEIKIPSMGESIAEVIVGSILVKNGSFVERDAEILELETDKVNQVLFAPQAGQLTLTVKEGDVLAVGQVIGAIEEKAASAKEKEGAEKSTPPEPPKKVAASLSPPTDPASLPAGQAKRYGKEDFLKELKQASDDTQMEKVRPSADLPATAKEQQGPRETRRPMSNIRKVIGQRLVAAQQTMAMLTTFNEVDLTAVIELRQKYQEAFIKAYGCKLGFMSFFVKAAVTALQAFPDLNSYIDGEEIVHRNYYDMGVAVGTDKGVIVPVLRDCEQLSFAQIEQAIEKYAKQAREGTLALKDLQGGGFTITNGGIYGSLLSTPILVPPQCGILGMHKIEKRAVVINDAIVIRSRMYVALSYDHRLIDGKEAVSFLVHVKNQLEDPARLLLSI